MTNVEINRFVTNDGTVTYCNNDRNPHREDGPAVIYFSGKEEWYRNGLLHRVDGPAVVDNDGAVEYWVNSTKKSGYSLQAKPLFETVMRREYRAS